MEYSVILSDAYEQDIMQTLSYLIDESNNITAAETLMTEIDNVADILKVTPELKAVSSKPALEVAGLREWFVGAYVLIYRIEEGAVYFERLFHQRQNFAELL